MVFGRRDADGALQAETENPLGQGGWQELEGPELGNTQSLGEDFDLKRSGPSLPKLEIEGQAPGEGAEAAGVPPGAGGDVPGSPQAARTSGCACASGEASPWVGSLLRR